MPKRPYTLLGLRFVGQHQRRGDAFTEFFFRDFSFTRLTPRTSSLYYQFRDQECYGELDPAPSLTPAHMGKWYGKRFEMCWEVRNSYGGDPFFADGKTFRFDSTGWELKSDKIPYPLEAAQRIQFPVKEKGTYWVRVRLRHSLDDKEPLPQEVMEREFRLDVIRGAASIMRPPIPREATIANCFVRIAPERKSLIYGADERFIVRVLFRNPGKDVKDTACRMVVRAACGGEEVKSLDLRPRWEENTPYEAEVDLSARLPRLSGTGHPSVRRARVR